MSEPLKLPLADFLAVQFGVHPIGYVSAWSKQTKGTKFFHMPDGADALADYIRRRAPKEDLYLALGLQREALDETKRGSAETVVSVPGLFADIDFSSAKPGSKRYPKDEQRALEILGTFPFPPTWVQNTGGGLHVHWLFPELLRTDTPEELALAKKISSRFQRAIQLHFKKNDAEIDSVGDLARNYRIPGTFNHKHGKRRPLKMLAWNPATRISVDEVLKWLDQADGAPKSKAKRAREENLDHERIRSECAWYRLVTGEGAASCDEPNWYAAASVTALCRDGENVFHSYSANYPGYSHEEAATKFARARAEAGPRTCKNVEGDLGFAECATCPHYGRITSPVQLGRRVGRYDPGDVGPVPLGYTRSGLFALLDRGMSVIVQASAQQLLSGQFLQGLAPSAFWAERFPPNGRARFDFVAAGEALIAACKERGAFLPQRTRGRGIWREGSRVVINLTRDAPKDTKHLYLCFEAIELDAKGTIDANRLLELLKLFKWRNPHDAIMLLGWLAVAPICGVLTWRPHCFVYGPSRSGKTTLHAIAARLLSPLVISADGGSSEAGIRQTIGPDSLPVIIDEFESDQNAGRITQIVRLARSASSAENPLLRGTPEGKAMQFSLCTTFFFSGINPRGMSPADDSRILQFELLMHDNNREIATKIKDEEAHFRDLGPVWCATMAKLADKIPASVQIFVDALPGADRRHRQNMGTLLAGAFVAMNGREPSLTEANDLIASVASGIELHAQPLERDDAAECFQKLLSHEVERYPLVHWIAVALKGEEIKNERVLDDARRIVRTYDLLLYHGNEFEGLLIRNGSPNLERIFERTIWNGGAWVKSLKKLQGAFTPDHPIHFPNAGKSRCTGVPFSIIPEPYEIPESQDEFFERTNQGKY